MKTLKLSALIQYEDNGYVSICPEFDIASQGDTVEEALHNLKEAVELFLETATPNEIAQANTSSPLLTQIEVAYA